MSISQALAQSSPTPEKSSGIIVIADNNPKSMDRIAAAFEKAGWRIATAHNGDEAVDIVNAAKVNAVMFDVSRSEINRCDTCRQLLNLGRKIPTMMIGGCLDQEQPSGPVNIDGTTIKLVTAEELQTFTKTAPKRFIWRGDAPDIVVTRTPGDRNRATQVCKSQLSEPKWASYIPN